MDMPTPSLGCTYDMDLLYFQPSHHLAQDSNSKERASDWQNLGHLLVLWPGERGCLHWLDSVQLGGVIPQRKIKNSHQKKGEWMQVKLKQKISTC